MYIISLLIIENSKIYDNIIFTFRYLFVYLSFVKIYVYKIFVKIYYLRRPVHIWPSKKVPSNMLKQFLKISDRLLT